MNNQQLLIVFYNSIRASRRFRRVMKWKAMDLICFVRSWIYIIWIEMSISGAVEPRPGEGVFSVTVGKECYLLIVLLPQTSTTHHLA